MVSIPTSAPSAATTSTEWQGVTRSLTSRDAPWTVAKGPATSREVRLLVTPSDAFRQRRGSERYTRTVPAETHVTNDPIGRDEIFEIVRDRLADILEIDPATISEGQSFVDDLEADSLALIELVESLEEELSDRTVGFRIEDEDLEDLKTVRDAVDYVHERVG